MSPRKITKPAKNTSIGQVIQRNKCQLCEHTVTGKMRPGLSCCTCNKLFHASCLNISVESLESIKKIEINWSCSKCKVKTPSRRSTIYVPSTEHNPSTERASLIATSSQTSQSSANIKSLQEFQSTAETSLNFLSGEFEKFKAEMTNLSTQVKRIAGLEKENEHLKAKLISLESRLNATEQQQNEKDVILSGIPEKEKNQGISTQQLVQQFTENIGLHMNRTEVESCCRFVHNEEQSDTRPHTSSSSHRPPKILIKFQSIQAKEKFKNHIRLHKKQHRIIDFCNEKVNYYASDNLTKYFNDLFNSAKNLAKNANYSYVWVSHSKIFAKKSTTSPLIPIKTHEDLKKIH